MELPEEFKQKVLLAIGGENRDKNLIEDLNEYGHLASMYLRDDAYNTFSAQEIVRAYQHGHIQKIIEEAQRRVTCEELLYEWYKIDAEQHEKQGRV